MLLSILATQPTDILHDPLLYVIITAVSGIIAALIVAFVTWITRKKQTHKELSYKVISIATITRMRREIENQLSILNGGIRVKTATQVVLKIKNTGNVMIARDDFDDPIKFIFYHSNILDRDILRTAPRNLIHSLDEISLKKAEMRSNGSSLELEKFMLNRKESVTFIFLLDRFPALIEVAGRFDDGYITEISQSRSRVRIRSTFSIILILIGIILAILVFIFRDFIQNYKPQ